MPGPGSRSPRVVHDVGERQDHSYGQDRERQLPECSAVDPQLGSGARAHDEPGDDRCEEHHGARSVEDIPIKHRRVRCLRGDDRRDPDDQVVQTWPLYGDRRLLQKGRHVEPVWDALGDGIYLGDDDDYDEDDVGQEGLKAGAADRAAARGEAARGTGGGTSSGWGLALDEYLWKLVQNMGGPPAQHGSKGRFWRTVQEAMSRRYPGRYTTSKGVQQRYVNILERLRPPRND
jgi:hypothetical protein